MKSFLPIQEPGYHAAADTWIRSSLSEGSVISRVVASDLNMSAGEIYVVGVDHPEAGFMEDFERGGVGSTAEADAADAAVARFISRVPGASLLLVEDDLALRTDPNLSGNAVFFGDRVVWWIDLAETASSVLDPLRSGASGYPLNAFLLGGDCGSLALSPGRSMADDAVAAIKKDVCGIIVAAYDAEAYLVWVAGAVVAELTNERSPR